MSRLPAREHVALVYSDGRLAERLGGAFLGSGGGSRGGALTVNCDRAANVMLYDNLYGFDDDTASRRMLSWVQSVKAASPAGAPATIASEAGLFLGNGPAGAYMMLEDAIGPRPDGVRMLCSCGLDRLKGCDQLEHVCKAHSHIIIECSLVIYRKKPQ